MRCSPCRLFAAFLALCTLTACILISDAGSASAQEVVFKKGNGLTKDVTLKDAAKYVQMSIDVPQLVWKAFSLSTPDAADSIKDMLTVVTAWEEARNIASDSEAFWKAFKTVLDFAISKGIDWWDKEFKTSYGTMLTLWNLYNDSLAFIHDRFFIPGLVDMAYDRYQALRQAGETHAAAWKQMNVPEPVVADTVVQVILPKHGVVPGAWSGATFDQATLSRLDKTVSGSAAGRTIVISHKPNLTLTGDRPFSLNRDISQRIEVLAPRVDNWQSWLLDLRNEVSKRDLEQRQNQGYPALSASDEKALEAEFKRLLAELKDANLGPKIRDEALAYIAKTLQIRYEQEAAKAAMEKAAAEAKVRLKKDMEALAAYSWPKLVQVNAVNQAGETVPVEGAALFVDGRLCTSENNGGKPCGTNRYGLAGVHLPVGGHDVEVRAPGYQPQEIYITAHVPDPAADGAKPKPEEYEVVLAPARPLNLLVGVVSEHDYGPIAGARMTLRAEGFELEQISDEDGLARFLEVPAGTILSLSVEAPGYEPAVFEGIGAADQTSGQALTFRLVPFYSSVRIMVLDGMGVPMPGAEVKLGRYIGRSDAQGMALFKKIPPSSAHGFVLQATLGDLPTAEDVLLIQPDAAGQEFTAEIRLNVLGSILATVRDGQNRMVAGAKAVLEGPAGRVVVAADQDWVRFSDLPPGVYYLSAEAPGHLSGEPTEIEITRAELMHKARLTLTAGMELKVLLLDKNRNTVSGRVALDGKWQSAPSGSAIFTGVTPGAHTLAAEGPGGTKATAAYQADPVATPRDTVTLALVEEEPLAVLEWSHSGYGHGEGDVRTYMWVRLGGKAIAAQDDVAAAFCASEGLKAVLPQFPGNTHSPSVSTVNAQGVEVCRVKADGGTAASCSAFRQVSCLLPPECDPNDPQCGQDQGDAPEWGYSSYGDKDGLRTFRNVRVNGKPVKAGEGEARTFCASLGLEPLTPQPAANITNWSENLFDANGWVGCIYEQPDGHKNICQGFRDITCKLPPPCDPSDPLCGLDVDASLNPPPDRAFLEGLMPPATGIPMPPSRDPAGEIEKQWTISDGFPFPVYKEKDSLTGFESLAYSYYTHVSATTDPDGEYSYDVFITVERAAAERMASVFEKELDGMRELYELALSEDYEPPVDLALGQGGYVLAAKRGGGMNHSIVFHKGQIRVQVRSSPWVGGLDLGKSAAMAVAARIP